MTSWNGSRSRITPAWAGKSQWAMTCYSGQQGSPPRGRGKGIVGSLHHALDGITPAWAGKSRMRLATRFPYRDHPRVGGEKQGVFQKVFLLPGSPPRGRGKVTRLYALADLEGITPAWAGKSCVLGLCFELFKDHPRVGGEKAGRAPRVQQQPGSPPRGRGKARRFSKSFSSARITPAWAGKSGQPRQPCQQPWDHPRVGGEKGRAVLGPVLGPGSPPRGRGKVTRLYALADLEGITPAWAGKRSLLIPHPKRCRDHPRVGGEKK